ncbi:MAG: ketopantoate reductase family protein [Lacrimispora sp.]|uniref:ketopantoate reductase family protein n=1 Tax=Lacrimispora sp. TaxID=2719234 RepID=UPI0039E2784B
MKIAVIGAGAMGSIYGAHLSLNNEVYMVDTSAATVDHIEAEGIKLQEDGTENVYRPHAVTCTEGMEPVDLVILFVKSLFSKAALGGNKCLIGPDTYVLTLQNGSGHEDILGEFVDREHIIIGTTEDNGAVLCPGCVKRGGKGNTNVGMLVEDKAGFLPKLKDSFESCGFTVHVHANIQQLIWDKLFTNVSLSVVTGILQVDIGYIAANEHAWNMTTRLIHEAGAVAKGLGLEADEAAITEKVRKTSEGSPNGRTSIRVDLENGRKTEVNTISGSVVRAAKKCGVPVPTHEFVVEMIHAMEDKSR